MPEKLEVLVDGGKATPGPPLGPALGPLGVNVIQVVSAINEKTKAFMGMKVPVTLLVDPKTKAFEIKVGTPPTTALIMKELGLEKGSGTPNSDFVGNLTVQQVAKIGEMKAGSMLAKDKRGRFREVVGTCVSMGVTVDGKDPRKVIEEIDAGEYQGLF
ncbi:MAG: 50S ribosomal protein L11 [Methanobacteriota archaeon]|nr:MAG: 50S ribosomal protein L11 [Euryarchaeota archaeon]